MSDLENNDSSSTIIALGAGMAVGALGIFFLVEALPILFLGGAGYLIYKGMTSAKDTETSKCETGQPKK